MSPLFSFFFFFNDTATTEIYTLSLHDALPISQPMRSLMLAPLPLRRQANHSNTFPIMSYNPQPFAADRKSTRLNSSHGYISYAVFCLKKKKKINSTYYYHTIHCRHIIPR